MVSDFEQREAARYALIPWGDWDSLPLQDRIDAVAFARVSRLVELHQSDAMQRHQRRSQARSSAGRKR